MLPDKPLELRIAGKKDFANLIRVLFLLVLLSAVLSPQPLVLTLFAVLLVGAGWIARTLYFPNTNDAALTLIIFSDGRSRLIPACGTVAEGCLVGQQWCTQRVAMLRTATAGEIQYLPVVAGQQAADEYRRLHVWLRQDIFSEISGNQSVGNKS